MNLKQTMDELEKLGDPQTKKTWLRHGATGNFFGVKIGLMKVLLKKLRGQQDLAFELYRTGNLDAMYLAGLLVDGAQMSKRELQTWAKAARWTMLAEYTLPWVACESAHARELALLWIDAKTAPLAAAGWNTYSGIVATQPDDALDLTEIESLMTRIVKEIDRAPNRVRYCMNGFVIAAGTSVKPLLAKAKAIAKKLKVEVDMHDTECKVPSAVAYIEKIEAMGRIGKKRKSMKC